MGTVTGFCFFASDAQPVAFTAHFPTAVVSFFSFYIFILFSSLFFACKTQVHRIVCFPSLCLLQQDPISVFSGKYVKLGLGLFQFSPVGREKASEASLSKSTRGTMCTSNLKTIALQLGGLHKLASQNIFLLTPLSHQQRTMFFHPHQSLIATFIRDQINATTGQHFFCTTLYAGIKVLLTGTMAANFSQFSSHDYRRWDLQVWQLSQAAQLHLGG